MAYEKERNGLSISVTDSGRKMKRSKNLHASKSLKLKQLNSKLKNSGGTLAGTTHNMYYAETRKWKNVLKRLDCP